MSIQSTGLPRWGRMNAAKERSGLSRSEIYLIARENPGLLKKRGAASIFDLEMLDRILAELPDAELKPPNAA